MRNSWKYQFNRAGLKIFKLTILVFYSGDTTQEPQVKQPRLCTWQPGLDMQMFADCSWTTDAWIKNAQSKPRSHQRPPLVLPPLTLVALVSHFLCNRAFSVPDKILHFPCVQTRTFHFSKHSGLWWSNSLTSCSSCRTWWSFSTAPFQIDIGAWAWIDCHQFHSPLSGIKFIKEYWNDFCHWTYSNTYPIHLWHYLALMDFLSLSSLSKEFSNVFHVRSPRFALPWWSTRTSTANRLSTVSGERPCTTRLGEDMRRPVGTWALNGPGLRPLVTWTTRF